MKILFKIIPLVFLFCHATFAHESDGQTCQIFKAQETTTSVNPVDPKKTKEQFDLIINRVTSLYADTIKELGANLTKDVDWEGSDVNAFAQQIKNEWILYFYGALYRNKHVTDDSMALTVCHELGHLIGGAPYIAGTKMSVEGQADFWGTSVCLKKYFTEFPETVEIKDGTAKQKCDARYPVDPTEKNTCYRSANAAMAMATFLSSMARTTKPDFDKRNPDIMKTTKQLHPEAQCRLDTYLAGSLCELGETGLAFEKKLLSENLTTDSQCSEEINGEIKKSEQRPTCWFNEYTNTLFTFYKEKIKSKSLTGLKGGTISLSYFNNLAGDYVVKLIPDARSAHYVKVETAEFKATLPASGVQPIIFNYKFMKRADRKLKFTLQVELNGKVILNQKDAFIINAFTMASN